MPIAPVPCVSLRRSGRTAMTLIILCGHCHWVGAALAGLSWNAPRYRRSPEVDLKKLHKQLDEAVAACYGWPRSVAQDAPEIVRRFTALN